MPRIRHIALTTENPAKTAAFYKEAFGLKEVRRSPNGAVFLTDGHINLAILNLKDQQIGRCRRAWRELQRHPSFRLRGREPRRGRAPAEIANGDPADRQGPRRDTMAAGGHANFEMKWSGPDGVVIDISHTGWEGVLSRLLMRHSRAWTQGGCAPKTRPWVPQPRRLNDAWTTGRTRHVLIRFASARSAAARGLAPIAATAGSACRTKAGCGARAASTA